MSEGTGYNLSFPTPESLPEDTVCRIFTLPRDRIFLGDFMGALEYLTDPDHWQAVGAVSPEDSAQAVFDAIDAAYDLAEEGVCEGAVQAPFWDEDSGDDADDEMSPAEQIWYGSWDGETFLETLAYVHLTNFLSTLFSPAAAVAFLVIPRAFRLLIRQNPHGANLLLFLDGGLFKVINGYSPVDKVAEFLISSPGTEMLLVHDGTHDPDATPDSDGNYVVDVVRGRLSVDDVIPPGTRWNDETGMIQFSPDGGTTWNDATGQDPRHSPAYQLPPRGGDDPRCDAAANMVAKLKFLEGIFESEISQFQMATAMLGVVLAFLPGAGTLIDVLIAAAEAAIAIGATLIHDAFTDAQWNLVEQALYCNLDSDGTLTANNLLSVISRIHDDCDAVVYDVLAAPLIGIFASIGEVGLTNAGATGDLVGDCTGFDCNWCYQYLWQACEPDSWNDVSGFSNTLRCDVIPHFYQGLGGAAPAALGIFASIGDGEGNTHITGFTLEWALDDAQGAQDQVVRFYDHFGGTLLYAWDSGIADHGNTGGTQTVHITGLDIHPGTVAIVGYAHDYAVAYNFSLEGDGYRPFPTTNC